MPGIRLVTNLSRQKAYDAAHTAARRLYFSTQPQADGEMIIRKGNMIGGIFLGALFPYCDFRLYVDQKGLGQVQVTLDWQTPWWVGWVARDRIRSQAQDLIEAISLAFLDLGGEVLSREAI